MKTRQKTNIRTKKKAERNKHMNEKEQMHTKMLDTKDNDNTTNERNPKKHERKQHMNEKIDEWQQKNIENNNIWTNTQMNEHEHMNEKKHVNETKTYERTWHMHEKNRCMKK